MKASSNTSASGERRSSPSVLFCSGDSSTSPTLPTRPGVRPLTASGPSGVTVTALVHDGDMSTTADFAAAARSLASEARRHGLVGPSYRCPPRLVGVDRTIRRRADGAIVSVRVRGRPWAAVLADMIEGVVVANRLGPPQSDRLRTELWSACGAVDSLPGSRDAARRVA